MNESLAADASREIGYALKRSGGYIAIKTAWHSFVEANQAAFGPMLKPVETMVQPLLKAAAPIANPIKNAIEPHLGKISKALGISTGDSVAGLVMMGGLASLSAALAEADYLHKIGNLTKIYEDEVKALTGKEKVSTKDLKLLAKDNQTLAEEIRRSKKQRNFGVVVSSLASVTSLAATAVLVPLIVNPLGLAAGTFALGAATFAANMGVGLVAYNAIKAPLHKVADKLFHLDDKTVNDRIMAMRLGCEQGKFISREEVLSAFVAARPELDQQIVSKFGQHFDDLSLETKHRAAEEINRVVPLDKMTFDINSGRVNVTELAFLVEGKISGVEHDGSEVAKHESKIRHFIKQAEEKMVDTKLGHVVENTMAKSEFITAADGNQPKKGGFVERYAPSKKSDGLGFAERIEQSRAEPAMLASPS